MNTFLQNINIPGMDADKELSAPQQVVPHQVVTLDQLMHYLENSIYSIYLMSKVFSRRHIFKPVLSKYLQESQKVFA